MVSYTTSHRGTAIAILAVGIGDYWTDHAETIRLVASVGCGKKTEAAADINTGTDTAEAVIR